MSSKALQAKRAEFKALKEAGQIVEGTTFKSWMEQQVAEQTPAEQVLETVETASEVIDQVQVQVQSNVGRSKAVIAKEIFEAELAEKGPAGMVRKDVIKRFLAEAGLTKNGSNTYYQNLRVKHGMADQLHG